MCGAMTVTSRHEHVRLWRRVPAPSVTTSRASATFTSRRATSRTRLLDLAASAARSQLSFDWRAFPGNRARTRLRLVNRMHRRRGRRRQGTRRLRIRVGSGVW